LKVHQGQAEIGIGNKKVMVRAGESVLLGTGPRKTRVNKHKSGSYQATALLLPKSLLSDLDLDGSALRKMLDQMSVELAPASDALQRLDGCIWYTARHLVSDASVPLSVTVAESAEQLLLNLFSFRGYEESPRGGRVYACKIASEHSAGRYF
jgi:hypothetical protein